ncbi:hypothetical protein TanjilG_19713 [Lupinus angustifolius]|uniref:Phytosulfokine n=1 Tax=Lupinus angustifolius TaxID=3871 RepID=A0A4P1RAI2_LUPAN|nr:PREDICTED: putative phytosulfokines 6 [Lupinus angustifolius]OIW06275.1 hypothetical protein TanjilG_19713 [Lupinus angustifolius]
MKQKIVFLFFVLLLSSFLASARDLPPKCPKQGESEVKVNSSNMAQSYATELNDVTDELIGSKKCNEKDEECSTRRIISEAHLDYIYTEHHNP